MSPPVYIPCFLFAVLSVAFCQITLTVDTQTIVYETAYPFLGNNIDVCWDASVYSPASARALRNANTRVIRFPGGAPALWYDWTDLTSMQGINYCEVGSPVTQVSDFLNYCAMIGAAPLIQTNTAWNDSHLGAFLDQLNANGTFIKFWEIGNEQDMASNGGLQNGGFSQSYMDDFKRQAAVIHQKMPGALVLGPVATNTWFWWGLQDIVPFLNQTGNIYGDGSVDGLSLHWYPGPSSGCDWPSNMVQEAWNGWAGASDYLRSTLATYDTRNLPIFITEVNAGSSLNCATSTVVMNALSNSDAFGVLRLGTIDAVQFFGTVHGAEDAYGLLYADDSPSPTFYAFLMWGLMGSQVLNVSGFPDITQLTAFASRTPTGNLQIIINNKVYTPTSITLNGFSATGLTVTTWQLSSTVPADGCWQSNFTYNGVLSGTPSLANHYSEPPPTTTTAQSSSYSLTVPGCSITLLQFSSALSPTPSVASPTPTSPTGSPTPTSPTGSPTTTSPLTANSTMSTGTPASNSPSNKSTVSYGISRPAAELWEILLQSMATILLSFVLVQA
jgi:hypothetical protein